jgi:hypothetical protein
MMPVVPSMRMTFVDALAATHLATADIREPVTPAASACKMKLFDC